MTIKHLVISGGGPTGIIVYGALQELAKQDVWSLENIESIYGTSIGSVIGVIIALGYDWEWINDYIIKRPWEKVLDLTPLSFVEAFHKKGVVGEDFIRESITPLFTAKDLPADVTLAGLYEATGIDIHIFTTEMNSARLSIVDLSHSTHPDLPVSLAMAMSGALPVLFCPVCCDDNCYIDGGVLNNFPLEDCFREKLCEESEVLAFKNIWMGTESTIKPESTMVDFLIHLIYRMRREFDLEPQQREMDNTLTISLDDADAFSSWSAVIDSEEVRANLINRGSVEAINFLTQRFEQIV